MASKTRVPVSINTPASGRLGALLRVPIDYLLEVYSEGRISMMITLPQTPSSYTQTRPSATVVTHTLGEVVREITQNHLTEIELRGVSGYSPRVGQTRDGGVSFLSGRAILEEFDKFLDEYQSRTAQDVDKTYLVFRALNEKQAFKVEPTEWRWSEDTAQNRFSYEWELKLEAYAHAPSDPRGSVFSPLTEIIQKSQEYINAGAGAVELASNALVNVRSEFEEARNTLRSLERISTALQNVADSVDGIRTFFTRDLPATYVNLANSYKRSYDDISELVGLDENDATRRTAEQIAYYALVNAGLSGVNSNDIERAKTTPTIERDSLSVVTTNQAPRFSVPFTLRAGDTLQSIALDAYGDASRWIEIKAYNGFRDALHRSDGLPLRMGDIIQVPFTNATEDDLGLPLQGDVFGTDLLMDSTGDLVFSDSEIHTVREEANLKQAITNRLLTEQGSAYPFPSYGLPLTIGSKLDARSVAFCASHVNQQLLSDARIRDVRDILVIDEGDQLAVSVTVIPISGGAVDVITPMRRV